MSGLDARLGQLPAELRARVASAAIETHRPWAAAYYRVSTDRAAGDNAQSLEHQRPEVLGMLLGRGFRLFAEPWDEVSGTKDEESRPGLRDLMHAAQRAQIKAIFVSALDRISRDDSFSGGLRLVGEFDRLNVAVFSHQEPELDVTGPFRSLYLVICMKVAADFRRKISANTNRALRHIQSELKERGEYRSPKTGRVITKLGRPGQVTIEQAQEAAALKSKLPSWTWGQVTRAMIAGGRLKEGTLRQTLQRRVERLKT